MGAWGGRGRPHGARPPTSTPILPQPFSQDPGAGVTDTVTHPARVPLPASPSPTADGDLSLLLQEGGLAADHVPHPGAASLGVGPDGAPALTFLPPPSAG